MVSIPIASAGFAEADPQGGLRLLVVDDNATNRAVLNALLSPLGAIVETAADGREALAAWEADRWDAILMDIHMPLMDGREASQAIRAREAATRRSRTPIIAVTASVLAHETNSYLAAGMDGFVAKPIVVDRLFAALETALSLSETRSDRAGAA